MSESLEDGYRSRMIGVGSVAADAAEWEWLVHNALATVILWRMGRQQRTCGT